MEDKEKRIIHINALKQALSHELKLTNVHRVIRFIENVHRVIKFKHG